MSSPQTARIGLEQTHEFVNGECVEPLLDPLARHLESIYSAARQLMTDQGTRSMADLVSTRQFAAHGSQHFPPRRVVADLVGETS